MMWTPRPAGRAGTECPCHRASTLHTVQLQSRLKQQSSLCRSRLKWPRFPSLCRSQRLSCSLLQRSYSRVRTLRSTVYCSFWLLFVVVLLTVLSYVSGQRSHSGAGEAPDDVDCSVLDHFFRNGNLWAYKSWIHLWRNQYRHFCYGKNVDMATWKLFISTKFSYRDEYRRKLPKVNILIAIVLSADFWYSGDKIQ